MTSEVNIIIVTGLSGSGKSTALNALEDAGFFCVDNMPVLLLPKFLDLRSGSASEVQKLAFGMDVREKEFAGKSLDVFEQLRKEGYNLEILYLEADEEVLLKRFSQTRRQHPVSEGRNLVERIRVEKTQLKDLRGIADRILDTSNYSVHQLKEVMLEHAERAVKTERMRIAVLSFGFKYGIPPEADFLVDVRFIPNPYFLPHLKRLNGKDQRVREFVEKWPETQDFLAKYLSLLDFLLPLYEKEGKSYLTLAVGCTGGRHRSVTVAEEIYAHLKGARQEITLTHRDIELP